MNKINKSTELSFKIILLFGTAIFLSFIPEFLHEFLGDWKCQGAMGRIIKGNYVGVGCIYQYNQHEPTYHWGYRHCLWCIMCVCLFIIQVINIINKINEKSNL